jgi:hypothetical protein
VSKSLALEPSRVLALSRRPLRSELHDMCERLNYILRDTYLDTAASSVSEAAPRVGSTRQTFEVSQQDLQIERWCSQTHLSLPNWNLEPTEISIEGVPLICVPHQHRQRKLQDPPRMRALGPRFVVLGPPNIPTTNEHGGTAIPVLTTTSR